MRQDDMPIWNNIKRLLRIENLGDSVEQARITQNQRTDQQQNAATLALAEYLNLLSGVPLPSTQQKSEFAEFVSAAHSWYKHLPANLPGPPFYFFLDKYAGCDRRLQSNGTAVLATGRVVGAQYRRLRSKLGAPKAITAMAHRLARLVYRMLKVGQHYVGKGAESYERRNRQQIEFLRKKAARLGLQLATHP